MLTSNPVAGFYAIEGVYRVSASDGVLIDSSRVADAWQTVVDRHASLRTVFVESLSKNEALFDQIVLKRVKADIVHVTCATDVEAVETLRSQASMESKARMPDHRFTICKASTGSVFCKLEISHTIVDGASMSIIFRELSLIYEGRLLSARGPSYSDYIAFLENQPAMAGIGYWRSYLADAECTLFPSMNDGVCPVPRELHSKRIQVRDIASIQSFCNLHSLTMANAFHTAWALTLQRYTGSNDVSYGYLMSTRDQSIDAIESVVGYLVNMLVCRVELSPETPLIAIMQKVQTDLSEGQAHCHTALSEVLHTLQLSGSSLFNTSLSYRRIPITNAMEQCTVTFDECFPYYVGHLSTAFERMIKCAGSRDSVMCLCLVVSIEA